MRYLTLLIATIALAFQPFALALPALEDSCESLCCAGEPARENSQCCPCSLVCGTVSGQYLVALLPVHHGLTPRLATKKPWFVSGDSAPSRTLDPELRPPRT